MRDDLKVTVSENKMAAFIRLPPERNVTARELRDALAAEGVVAGISAAALREALAGPRGMFYQIAWGKKLTEDDLPAATVVRKFPRSQGAPAERVIAGPRFREEWMSLTKRGAVAAGDVLAFLRGVDRYPKIVTVTGEERVFAAFPPFTKPGKNVKLSLNGTSILAAKSGIPYQDGDTLCVLDRVEIVGDIDRQTGDVSFPGDLTVRGNVQHGYRVSAAGDIVVTGILSGSAATGARIYVGGGINASGEAVEAGAGVTCKFCENSLIRSGGDVKVTEAVVHSVIETDGILDVSGERGKVVGGLVRATVGARVATAGTPMGIPTVFELGISPKERHEQARVERELLKVRGNLKAAERAGSKGRGGDKKDFDAIRLKRMKRLWQEQEEALARSLASINEAFAKRPKGFFSCAYVLPGVKLVMGTEVIEVKTPVHGLFEGVDSREAHR